MVRTENVSLIKQLEMLRKEPDLSSQPELKTTPYDEATDLLQTRTFELEKALQSKNYFKIKLQECREVLDEQEQQAKLYKDKFLECEKSLTEANEKVDLYKIKLTKCSEALKKRNERVVKLKDCMEKLIKDYEN